METSELDRVAGSEQSLRRVVLDPESDVDHRSGGGDAIVGFAVELANSEAPGLVDRHGDEVGRRCSLLRSITAISRYIS